MFKLEDFPPLPTLSSASKAALCSKKSTLPLFSMANLEKEETFDYFTLSKNISTLVKRESLEAAQGLLEKGIKNKIFMPDFGFFISSRTGDFILDLHENKVLNKTPLSCTTPFLAYGQHLHYKGISSQVAKVILYHILKTEYSDWNHIRIQIVVGCHGDDILKDEMIKFVESDLFAKNFPGFSKRIYDHSRIRGRLVFELSRNHSQG